MQFGGFDRERLAGGRRGSVRGSEAKSLQEKEWRRRGRLLEQPADRE